MGKISSAVMDFLASGGGSLGFSENELPDLKDLI